MTDARDHDAIDELMRQFFSAFDNRNNRPPSHEAMVGCFADRAIITRYADGEGETWSAEEFATPRIALLTSGELVDFNEWEESATTQIVGPMAIRSCRYGKAGLLQGRAYAGTWYEVLPVGQGRRGMAHHGIVVDR
jgi:hypothetical protein